MTDFVLDASVTLQWFLQDEINRKYSLDVLAALIDRRAFVPILWFYEIGNGLIMAYRRKRVSLDQLEGFLERLRSLPIYPVEQTPAELLGLPLLAHTYNLTNYDAAYLALAAKLNLPLATTDKHLNEAIHANGLEVMKI